MFLTDTILPEEWSMIWIAISAIIFIYGFKKIITEQRNNPEFKQMFLYALIFTIFSMAISIFSPFIIGYIGGATYAGMTEMGLAALFFNPWINSVIYLISSAISLFLGRLTLTTFGANIFAVAFIGSITIQKTWKILEDKKIYIKLPISIIAETDSSNNNNTTTTTSIPINRPGIHKTIPTTNTNGNKRSSNSIRNIQHTPRKNKKQNATIKIHEYLILHHTLFFFKPKID